MRSIVRTGVLSASLFAVCSCVPQAPPKTSLELQAIQAREFETSYGVAFASVISVFQDQGYIIEEADKDTGLITANSPTQQTFMLFVGQVMRFRKATAFLETMPSKMVRVRLNFVDAEESSSGYGMKGARSDPVVDPAVYQSTFEQVQKAIFVRTSVGQ